MFWVVRRLQFRCVKRTGSRQGSLSELDGTKDAIIRNVLQFKLLPFLTIGMEVNARNTPVLLAETDVIEPVKACTSQFLDPMVWYKEVFLPSHKNVLFQVE